MSGYMIFAAIGISAVCTFLLRALPFLAFRGNKKMPAWLEKLGRVLPSAIMAVLIVYCMKDIKSDAAGLLLPRIVGVLAVLISYKWKHNTLFTIAGGTAVYMICLRLLT